jgi:hypothetical protein
MALKVAVAGEMTRSQAGRAAMKASRLLHSQRLRSGGGFLLLHRFLRRQVAA